LRHRRRRRIWLPWPAPLPQEVRREEDRMRVDLRLPEALRPWLNQSLPGLIRRMGFAGQDQLHRTVWVGQQAPPLRRTVQQVRALGGREAAREPQRQGVGIKQRSISHTL
jgi:hypothetical protein